MKRIFCDNCERELTGEQHLRVNVRGVSGAGTDIISLAAGLMEKDIEVCGFRCAAEWCGREKGTEK